MGSRWERNYWELNFEMIGGSMAARVLEGEAAGFYVSDAFEVNQPIPYWNASPLSMPTIQGGLFPPNPNQFPFGLVVEPAFDAM